MYIYVYIKIYIKEIYNMKYTYKTRLYKTYKKSRTDYMKPT